MNRKVSLYCRVSTSEQSCARQINDLRQVAANFGYEIVAEYVDEGVSGVKTSRAAFDQMLKDAFSRKFDMLMVTELSRLSRRTRHLLETVETLQDRRIDLYVHNQQIDTSTATGKLFFTVASAFMEFERDNIAERVKSGISNYRKKHGGNWVGGRKSNLTDQVAKQIVGLKGDGWGILRIAKECRVSTQTVYRVLENAA